MKTHLYVAPHINRQGDIDGYDVRERSETHNLVISPCESEAEAHEELARFQALPIEGRVVGSVNGPATLHPDGRIEIHPTPRP